MKKKYQIYQAMKDILIDYEDDFYDVDMYTHDICAEIFTKEDKYGIKNDLASFKQALILLVRDDALFDNFSLLGIVILFEELIDSGEKFHAAYEED